ncbi:MAG: hypothetical protein CVT48_05385 [Thermoplasmata archaeon HGW-Thermoplasmata-1]|nr:MAG: hypothetical protein CVT48_05385 [Thermoplasmata archaeon HGW-Thermoplasmata-1]
MEEHDAAKIAEARNVLRNKARGTVAETLAAHSSAFLSVSEISKLTGLYRDTVICTLDGIEGRFSVVDSLTV